MLLMHSVRVACIQKEYQMDFATTNLEVFYFGEYVQLLLLLAGQLM